MNQSIRYVMYLFFQVHILLLFCLYATHWVMSSLWTLTMKLAAWHICITLISIRITHVCYQNEWLNIKQMRVCNCCVAFWTFYMQHLSVSELGYMGDCFFQVSVVVSVWNDALWWSFCQFIFASRTLLISRKTCLMWETLLSCYITFFEKAPDLQ